MGHVSYEFHRELFQKNRHHLLVYREPHWPAQIAAVPVHDTAVLQKDEKKTNVDFHIKKNLLFPALFHSQPLHSNSAKKCLHTVSLSNTKA